MVGIYISVIVPVLNEISNLDTCLNRLSLFQDSHDNVEIIVVDNGSEDGSYELAKSYTRFKVLRLPGSNVGAVRNFGARNSSGSLLAFLDADCLITDEWEHFVLDRNLLDGKIVFGGGCLLPKNASWIEKDWLIGDNNSRLPRDLIGASIIIKKADFFDIGGFNENVTSGEDTLLSHAIRESGHQIKITNSLSVVHLGNAKSPLDFIKRQSWHAENYLKNLGTSIKDPTFFFVVSFIFSLLIIIPAYFISFWFFLLSIALILFIPSIFSIKRIHRSRISGLTVSRVLRIYTLDFFYVFGRSFGIVKSLIKR